MYFSILSASTPLFRQGGANLGKVSLALQAGLEASPAGGGGWAGAREARTAAPDGGRVSVARFRRL